MAQTTQQIIDFINSTSQPNSITGKILAEALNGLIAKSSYAGVAKLSTDPGTPEGSVFYIATEAGTFTHFNNAVVKAGEFAVFVYKNGSWLKESVNVASNLGSPDDDADAAGSAFARINYNVVEVEKIIEQLKKTLSESETPVYTTYSGVIKSGILSASDLYSYSSPIFLKKDDTILFKAINDTADAIALTDSSGSSYKRVAGEAGSIEKLFSYTATEDCYVALCWRSASAEPSFSLIVRYSEKTLEFLQKNVLKGSVDYSVDGNAYIVSDGKKVVNENYRYSNPFSLIKGVSVDFSCYAGAPSESLGIAVLSKYDNGIYTPVVVENNQSSKNRDYSYKVGETGKYVICYRINATPVISVYISDLTDIIDLLLKCNELETYIIGEKFDITSEIGNNSGYISRTGSITASSSYNYSNPILLNKNSQIVFTAWASTVSVIAETDEKGSYYIPLIINDENKVKEYKYETNRDMYIAVCWKTTEQMSCIKIQRSSEFDAYIQSVIDDNTTNSDPISLSSPVAPNLSIKAFKELNYADNTLPISSQVLWVDENDNFYQSRNLYSERKKIFTFDKGLGGGKNSGYFSAFIMPNGDVLFVYRTEFAGGLPEGTEADNIRKNPILYEASNNYSPHVIDFGDNLKPSGWLQNCGAVYSYRHNVLLICEYTRSNQDYARVWRVSGDIKEISNWSVVLQKEIPKPYETGFKHFHTCQADTFSEVLYVTSGDNNVAAAVWYSTDAGATFIQLDTPNRGKYRMLNMTFTKEYIYWGSDDWDTNHKIWRASRLENGVMDKDSITEMYQFPSVPSSGNQRLATYSSVYLPLLNAIVFLDRDDEGDHEYIPVNLYDIDNDTVHELAKVYRSGDSGLYGFRNEAVTRVSQDNVIAVSFGINYRNNIALLGNSDAYQINNILMRVCKVADKYTISFDSIY